MGSDEHVDHALDTLDQLRGEAPWHAPDQIRHIARRRTITRRSLLGAAGLAVAGGVVDALLPDSSPARRTPPAPLAAGVRVHEHSGAAVELVADVQPLSTNAGDLASIARSQQQFAIDLLRATTSSANVVLSPSSLAIALAMLQLGARGRTRDEIAAALHTASLSARQQAAGWAALTQSLAADADSVLESANSVWQQRGLALRHDYMTALAQYFQAGIWQVDFARDMAGADAAINDWVKQHTHGRITRLFDPGELTPETQLVLANAEYFKAAWKYRFDPQLTHPAPFHRADGTTVSVPFMKYHGKLAVTGNGRWYAAQFPYAGDRFAAQLIMPMRGSLAELSAALTPDDLHSIGTASISDEPVDTLIPKFTVQTYTQLNDTLQHLGIRAAFGAGADFSAMSPAGLQLATVVQRDYLKVDEQGTEAAAVTGGAMVQLARVGPSAFDRPFLFLVRDTRTGTVLFAGQIQDPSAG